MRKLLITLIIALIAQTAFGEKVQRDRAMQVAQNFWKQETGSTPQLTDLSATVGLRELYLFDVDGGKGYIVVSADDIAKPILAYSSESGFPTSNIAPAVMEMLRSYEEEIAFGRSFGEGPAAEVTKEWQDLENGIKPAHADRKAAVAQMMTSKWNQSAPYNNMCPAASGEHCVTGCVATAISQVMRYWRYPEHGVGQHSYSYNDRPIAVTHMLGDSNAVWLYDTLTVDFENSYYDWDNMPDMATTSSPEVEQNAVAQLCYHCGVALEMVYTPEGSGSFMTVAEILAFDSVHYPRSIAAELIIPRFFGYSPAAEGRMRWDYTTSQWVAMIKNELNNGRPLVFAGNAEGSDYGHAFVLDGYNARSFFHCNFGWGGQYDGDFRIDEIAPTGSMAFVAKQSGIFLMFPPGRGGDDEPDPVAIEQASERNDNIVVYSRDRSIRIEGGKVNEGEVYDLMGRRVATFDGHGEVATSVRMDKGGIYLVRIGNKAHKVMVR